MMAFLSHFIEFFYTGVGNEPWWHAAIWGNVFVGFVVVPIGWLWSKTKFWPLRPLKHVLSHTMHTTMLLEEVHHKLHTGEDHPRVQARVVAGEHPTPKRPRNPNPKIG